MKYRKGEFVIVPNTQELDKVSATAQALFVWICVYADNDGICFPSRSKLASNLNCSVSTVDTYIKELVDCGFITKTNRKRDNEKITNLYQIVLRGSVKSTLGSVKNSPRGSVKSTHRTISNRTISTQLGERSSQEEIRVVSDVEEKPKKVDKKYVQVFECFNQNWPRNWQINKTQRLSAENLLKERGLEQIKKALEFYDEAKDEPFCPVVVTPYDLDSKWKKLNNFKKKHYGD